MVTVVYKSSPVDYTVDDKTSADGRRGYRSVLLNRVTKGKKRYHTDIAFATGSSKSDAIVFNGGDFEKMKVPVDWITDITFVVTSERCFAEVLILKNDTITSMVVSPEQTLEELGEEATFDFYNVFSDAAASAGIDMVELIDPDNPLGLESDEGAADDVADDDMEAQSADADAGTDALPIPPAPPAPVGFSAGATERIPVVSDNQAYGNDEAGDASASIDDALVDDPFEGEDGLEELAELVGIAKNGETDVTGAFADEGSGEAEDESADTSDEETDGAEKADADASEPDIENDGDAGEAWSGENTADDISDADESEEDVDEGGFVEEEALKTLEDLSAQVADASAGYDEILNSIAGDFADITGEDIFNEDFAGDAEVLADDDDAASEDTASTDPNAEAEQDLDDASRDVEAEASRLEYDLREFSDKVAGSDQLLDSVQKYLDSVERPSDEFVRELVQRISKQDEEITDLENALQREQRTGRDSAKRLAEATAALNEQQEANDKLARDLRFALQNKEKAERFVKEANEKIGEILAKTRESMEKARKNMYRMRAQVEKSDDARKLAEERAKELEALREADRVDYEQKKIELEEAKEDAARRIADADARVDEFTREVSAKLAAQVERAEKAESDAEDKAREIERLTGERDECLETIAAKEREIASKSEAYGREARAMDAAYAALEAKSAEDLAEAKREAQKRYDAVVSEKDAGYAKLKGEYDEQHRLAVEYKTRYDMRCREYDRLSERHTAVRDSLNQLTVSTGAVLSERDEYAVFVDKERARVEEGVAKLREALSATPTGIFGRKKKWDALFATFSEFLDELESQNALVAGARQHLADAQAERDAGRDPYDLAARYGVDDDTEETAGDDILLDLDELADGGVQMEDDEDENNVSLTDLFGGRDISEIIEAHAAAETENDAEKGYVEPIGDDGKNIK